MLGKWEKAIEIACSKNMTEALEEIKIAFPEKEVTEFIQNVKAQNK